MTQRTVIIAGIFAVVALCVVTVFGWSSWTSSAQRSQKQNSQRQRTNEQQARQDNAQSNTPDTRRDVLIDANRAPQAAKFGEGTWLNSEALSLESLRGRVVLIDFWTFGCYNCRNTLPTVKRFDQNYRSKGLTIVGVHAPESDYEKGIDNVREAVQRLGVKYPVVTDNNYDTWRAYNIQAWPTVVILDKQGRIRYTHIGEGDYEQQERIIKTLLAEQASASEAGRSNSTAANQTGIITNSNERRELAMNDRVTKTDAEWRQELTPEQYRVLREHGTERAFTGELNDNHEQGTYHCAACHNALFDSDTKFDSGTGWPSFYAPVFKGNVRENVDVSLGMKRTEVVCGRCGGHLGHVFNDGPQPTGLRYCMNSVALNFEKK